MKKAIAMLLATVMCTAMLTGCGSDSAANESSQASGSSVTETAAATTTEVAATTEAADKTEGGVLVFGTNAEFPPFEYVGDDGEPDGFDVALIKAVGEKLGMEVQVENMEFDSLVSSIGNRIDGAIAGMTVTDDRKEQVDFSDPYYEAVQYVIVAADSEIAAADDLKNKTIGSQLGTTGMFLCRGYRRCYRTDLQQSHRCCQRSGKRQSRCGYHRQEPCRSIQHRSSKARLRLSMVQSSVSRLKNMQLHFPKGSELVDQINQALEDLKADGTFDALVAQYIGE